MKDYPFFFISQNNLFFADNWTIYLASCKDPDKYVPITPIRFPVLSECKLILTFYFQDTYLAHSVMDSIFLLFEKVENKHGWLLVNASPTTNQCNKLQ